MKVTQETSVLRFSSLNSVSLGRSRQTLESSKTLKGEEEEGQSVVAKARGWFSSSLVLWTTLGCLFLCGSDFFSFRTFGAVR